MRLDHGPRLREMQPKDTPYAASWQADCDPQDKYSLLALCTYLGGRPIWTSRQRELPGLSGYEVTLVCSYLERFRRELISHLP